MPISLVSLSVIYHNFKISRTLVRLNNNLFLTDFKHLQFYKTLEFDVEEMRISENELLKFFENMKYIDFDWIEKPELSNHEILSIFKKAKEIPDDHFRDFYDFLEVCYKHKTGELKVSKKWDSVNQLYPRVEISYKNGRFSHREFNGSFFREAKKLIDKYEFPRNRSHGKDFEL